MDYYNLIFLCAIWVLASLEYSLDLKTDFYYPLFPDLGGLFKFYINVQQNSLMAVKWEAILQIQLFVQSHCFLSKFVLLLNQPVNPFT